MNEAGLIVRIKNFLEGNLAGPIVVIKHHDSVTAGIPDLSIAYRVVTTWVEVKLLRTGSKGECRKAFDPRQLAFMHRIARVAPAFYLIGHQEEETVRLRVSKPFEVHVWRDTGKPLGKMNRGGYNLSDDLGWFVNSYIKREGSWPPSGF